MCNPLAVQAAVAIASSAAQYSATKKAAAYQDEGIRRNSELQAIQTSQQMEQQNQRAQEQMSQRAKEALIEEGRLKVALGESGLQGATDQRTLDESQNNAAYDISTIENNRLKMNESSHAQGMSNEAQSVAQYNSVKRPSLIGTGLQIAGGLADTLKPTPKPAQGSSN